MVILFVCECVLAGLGEVVPLGATYWYMVSILSLEAQKCTRLHSIEGHDRLIEVGCCAGLIGQRMLLL